MEWNKLLLLSLQYRKKNDIPYKETGYFVIEKVHTKLERAEYFLRNMKALAEEVGGFPYIQKRQEVRANLDGFFFEIISAKDFFLQGINDLYKLNIPKDKATNISVLKHSLEKNGKVNAIKVVSRIDKAICRKNTWFWKLNNYRNAATHKELLQFGSVATVPTL